MLTEAAGAHVLATSREPLRVAGEAIQPVPPLTVPPDSALGAEELMRYEACRLFLARGAGSLDDGEAGQADAEAVARIVNRLDGLPLAIELAAGKLRSLPLTDLAAKLEDRLSLLSDGDRTAPPRQRTLEATLRWSYDLLTDDERRLLIRLAVFAGDFDADTAEAVTGYPSIERSAVLVLLTRLVDKSLLSPEGGDPPRYRLLETVRAFVLARAAATSAFDSAAGRHRDHYTVLGEQVFRHMLDAQLDVWLQRTRTDEHNFRAALLWSLDHGDGEPALQLASALTAYWFRTGQLS